MPPARRKEELRRTASVEARIEHFDEERGCLRVPNPKGGEGRAFDLSLSGALLDLVRHRIEENRIIASDLPRLFPSDSASGHVAQVRVAITSNPASASLMRAGRWLV